VGPSLHSSPHSHPVHSAALLLICPQAHIVHNIRIFELAATLSPEEMELLTALATLAESGPRRLRPAYARDLHHLVRDAKPAGAAAAAESVASV